MKEALDRRLLALKVLFEGLDTSELEQAKAAIGSAPRIYVGGLGRSGDIVRAFAARLARANRSVFDLFDGLAPPLGEGDLVVIGSGSGTTATLLAAIEKARAAKASILLLTANAISPMARLADRRLLLPPMMPLDAPTNANDFLGPMQVLFEQALLLLLDEIANQLTEHRAVSHERG